MAELENLRFISPLRYKDSLLLISKQTKNNGEKKCIVLDCSKKKVGWEEFKGTFSSQAFHILKSSVLPGNF